MIRDARHPLLTPLMHRYVRWRLRRSFRGVWCSGALPHSDEPLIVYANHSNFWDGLVVHALAHAAGREGYAVMEEHNLARHRALTRLGAFSLRRGDRASALETLRYATTVLQRPGATVLIFPQGKLVARARRPELGTVAGAALLDSSSGRLGDSPQFERGLEVLARMSRVRAVPVALRYAFFEHEFPDVLIAAGAPHAVDSLAACEQRLGALVAQLDAVERPSSSSSLLVPGRRSIAEHTLLQPETS